MSQTETPVVMTEDRTVPAVVYGLYLLGWVGFITIPIGLVVAYMNLDKAGPRMRTHYDFQIRSFWIGVAIFLSLGLLIGISAVLSVLLIGLPFLFLFIFLWGMVGIWFTIRSIVGLLYLSQGEPYPRPNTWLI